MLFQLKGQQSKQIFSNPPPSWHVGICMIYMNKYVRCIFIKASKL